MCANLAATFSEYGKAPGDDAIVMLRYSLLLRRCVVVVKTTQYRRRNQHCVALPRLTKENNLPQHFLRPLPSEQLLSFDQGKQQTPASLFPSTAMASSNVPDNGRLSNIDPQPPFFNLSAELRNGIYGLILPGGLGWKIVVSQDTEPNTEPPLLQVNKQIRAEAGSLYYGSNIFEVTVKADSIYVLADWAASLSRTDHAYVRRLELNFVLEDRHFEQGLDKGYVIGADSIYLW
jgi:hypothetical protein